ncbi:MAG: ATP-binding cassette domain-containing protein [Chloroflexi bacterium]|nr:ATP-binding cassette domain-containing protein [Chloroflexota bacterium]
MTAKKSPLIEYKNVTVMRNNRKVLEDVSFSIDIGEHVAILGANGAGKSSIIKTITRELYPLLTGSHSYLRILGKESWDVFELRNQLGIVDNDLLANPFINVSCRQMVLSGFFGSIGIWHGERVTPEMEKMAEEVMKFLGIRHLADAGTSEVSTGEFRLALIGRALVNSPQTMLLDEPTSNLDPAASQRIRRTLHELASQGKSIVMITHNLSDIIPQIDRVVFVRKGRIVKDCPKQEALTTGSLSDLFGAELEVIHRDGYYYCL